MSHRWEDLSSGSVGGVTSPLHTHPILLSLIQEFAIQPSQRRNFLPSVEWRGPLPAAELGEGAWVSELRQILVLNSPSPQLPWGTQMPPVPEPSGGPAGRPLPPCGTQISPGPICLCHLPLPTCFPSSRPAVTPPTCCRRLPVPRECGAPLLCCDEFNAREKGVQPADAHGSCLLCCCQAVSSCYSLLCSPTQTVPSLVST